MNVLKDITAENADTLSLHKSNTLGLLCGQNYCYVSWTEYTAGNTDVGCTIICTYTPLSFKQEF